MRFVVKTGRWIQFFTFNEYAAHAVEWTLACVFPDLVKVVDYGTIQITPQ